MNTSQQRTKLLVLGGLAALLLIQIHYTQSRARVISVPIEIGEPLPFTLKGIGDLARNVYPHCMAAYICSSRCPFCADLAATYISTHAAPNNTAIMLVYWLMADNPVSAKAWADEHGLDPTRVVTLSPRQPGWFKRKVYGRITSTPTRVILSDEFEVLDIRPSNEIPQMSHVLPLCR